MCPSISVGPALSKIEVAKMAHVLPFIAEFGVSISAIRETTRV
jgi:hypothetical protein